MQMQIWHETDDDRKDRRLCGNPDVFIQWQTQLCYGEEFRCGHSSVDVRPQVKMKGEEMGLQSLVNKVVWSSEKYFKLLKLLQKQLNTVT